MLDLIKCELFKLKKNLAFIVVTALAGAYALFFVGIMAAIAYFADMAIDDAAETFVISTMDELKFVAEAMGVGSGLMGMQGAFYYILAPGMSTSFGFFSADPVTIFVMVAVVISSIIVSDYRNGTVRNLVTSGKSRTKVLFAKLIICVSYSGALILGMSLISMVINVLIFGWGIVPVGTFFINLGLLLLVFMAFATVVALICLLTKSTGASIGVSIALIMLMYIFGFIASVIDMLAVIPEISDNAIVVMLGDVLSFLSECYIGNDLALATDPFVETGKIIKVLIVGVITLGGTAVLGWRLFKTKDIK